MSSELDGEKGREVPWSLLSKYNVLDLIEAGKAEQNTAVVLNKIGLSQNEIQYFSNFFSSRAT